MKGPTSGPVWGGQAPAAFDALPDLPPLRRACWACPALFSVALTLIWQRESSGVSQEGLQLGSSPGTESPPGALLSPKMSWGPKNYPVSPIHAGDCRVAWQAWSFSRCPDISPALVSSAQVDRASNGNLPHSVKQRLRPAAIGLWLRLWGSLAQASQGQVPFLSPC